MIKRLLKEVNSVLNANKMILHYPQLKVYSNRVNLHYYNAGLEDIDGNIKYNLGDCLSEVVVNYMLSKEHISNYEIALTRHLYAIGSILLMGYQNATVWGVECHLNHPS